MMLFVLGIGSTVGMGSCIIRSIRDQFQSLSNLPVALCLAVVGFCISIIYTTPGGQFILNLVDFYGASLPALVLAIGELVAVGWVYGIKRFCEDIQFMTGQITGIYWRICWGIVAPGLMLSVLIYTLIEFKPLTYKDVEYPYQAHVCGWTLLTFGLAQIPAWILYELLERKKINKAFLPKTTWGPLDATTFDEYTDHRRKLEFTESRRSVGLLRKLFENIFA